VTSLSVFPLPTLKWSASGTWSDIDLLVVASNGGAAAPGWFHNLQADPTVTVQVKADQHTARARVATPEEKPELWRIMTATGTPYDDFQAKADHEIPVVVLEPVSV